jgi:hypothetical protein
MTSMDKSGNEPARVVDPAWVSAKESVYFGSAPLIEGEDEAIYNQFLANMTDLISPVDLIERIWVRDVVDLQWEVDRLRRIKASLISIGKQVETETVLRLLNLPCILGGPDEDGEPYPEGSLQWLLLKGDDDSLKKAAELLKAAGRRREAGSIEQEALVARGFRCQIGDLERLERIVMMIEARRDKALRQLEERRVTLGARARRAVQQIEDAEFRVIEAEPLEAKRAA